MFGCSYTLQYNNGLGWLPVISGDLSMLNRVKKEITSNFNGLNIKVEYRVIRYDRTIKK